ncbi:MAG: hypothetical protein ABIA63_03130 [bacterium]
MNSYKLNLNSRHRPQQGKLPYRTIVPILIFLCICQTSFSFIPENLTRKTDSLFSLVDNLEQITAVSIFLHQGNVYFISTHKTLNFPLFKVQQQILKYTDYKKIFKPIKESLIIETDNSINPYGTLLFRVSAWFARTWFLSNIDSIGFDDQGRYGLYISQNQDEKLNRYWYKKCHSWFTIEYRYYYMNWYLKKIDGNKTRVALVSCVAPKKKIPVWLFKFTSKFIYPRFIKDLERALKK